MSRRSGLHPLDVQTLLQVFQALIDNGATVLVIEHDLDVIRNADYIIDMGPAAEKTAAGSLLWGTLEQIKTDAEQRTGKISVKIKKPDTASAHGLSVSEDHKIRNALPRGYFWAMVMFSSTSILPTFTFSLVSFCQLCHGRSHHLAGDCTSLRRNLPERAGEFRTSSSKLATVKRIFHKYPSFLLSVVDSISKIRFYIRGLICK